MQQQAITALRQSLQTASLPFVEGEPLAAHTTFRIGGPATFWCTPQDRPQLRGTLACCKKQGVRVYLLGNGSNTLFADEGFDGAVVTDWGDMDVVVNGADAVAAGNDIVMPGGPPVIRQILKGYEEARVTREEMETATGHLLCMIRRIHGKEK